MSQSKEFEGMIDDAVDVAYRYAGFDGAHHKQWAMATTRGSWSLKLARMAPRRTSGIRGSRRNAFISPSLSGFAAEPERETV